MVDISDDRKQHDKTVDCLHVDCCDGKYTVIQNSDGELNALRYGEPWRSCYGDKLILALSQDLYECRIELAKAKVRQGENVIIPDNTAEGWQDISTAPKDGTCILVWRPDEGDNCHKAHVGIDRWSGNTWYHSRRYQQPTYWQSLPLSPEQTS